MFLVPLSAQSAAADNSAWGVRLTQNIRFLAGNPTAELQPFHSSAFLVLTRAGKCALGIPLFAAITVTTDCGTATIDIHLDLIVEFNYLYISK